MSFLKKITNLLFEETDVDVIAEDELEDVQLKHKSYDYDDDKEVVKEIVEEPIKEQVKKPVFSEPVQKIEPKKFVSIEITDKPVVVEEKEKVVETPVRNTRVVPKEEKKDFNFSPVISPIFGAKEEVAKKKTANKVDMVNIPRAKKKKNPLGTIISPYFGVSELEEFEAEAQKVMEEKQQIRELDTIDFVDEDVLEKHQLEEELSSVSLEELLSNDSDNDVDDLMQISLFGESTPINETNHVDVDDSNKLGE